MMYLAAVFLILFVGVAPADTVVAAKTIRPNTVLTLQDVAIRTGSTPAAISDVSQVLGLETRVVIYAGRPIRAEDLGPPALVDRNQLVTLVFAQSGLSISTIGRALDRGAVGDTIRVLNQSSKTTLFGTVLPNGHIEVSAP